jgi:hypothetical protein
MGENDQLEKLQAPGFELPYTSRRRIPLLADIKLPQKPIQGFEVVAFIQRL